MLYGARGGRVEIGTTDMDYLVFGQGPRTLILLPGLSDGLRTVRGMAVPMADAYRAYAKRFRVYVFSRKNELEPDSSTQSMARDLSQAMEALGIGRACVMGVSQGGMIAQYLAAGHPDQVERLVLAVTLCCPNETVQEAVGRWIQMAEAGDYRGIVADTAERSYSEDYLRRKKLRLLYPLLGLVGKPKSFRRFLIQANACLGHDASGVLGQIRCPVLVLGGGADRIVGGQSSAELAARIPGSRLVVYEGLSHGAYEETPEFDREVLDFLC